MELLTPSSEAEDELLRSKFAEKADSSLSHHIGATSMGYDDTWYAIHTGKIFNYDFEWRRTEDYYGYDRDDEAKRCLKLHKRYETVGYDTVSCTDIKNRFICQRVTEGKTMNIFNIRLFKLFAQNISSTK